jgi:hypothetical protein
MAGSVNPINKWAIFNSPNKKPDNLSGQGLLYPKVLKPKKDSKYKSIIIKARV